jgi:hypothetical protein
LQWSWRACWGCEEGGCCQVLGAVLACTPAHARVPVTVSAFAAVAVAASFDLKKRKNTTCFFLSKRSSPLANVHQLRRRAEPLPAQPTHASARRQRHVTNRPPRRRPIMAAAAAEPQVCAVGVVLGHCSSVQRCVCNARSTLATADTATAQEAARPVPALLAHERRYLQAPVAEVWPVRRPRRPAGAGECRRESGALLRSFVRAAAARHSAQQPVQQPRRAAPAEAASRNSTAARQNHAPGHVQPRHTDSEHCSLLLARHRCLSPHPTLRLAPSLRMLQAILTVLTMSE